MKQNLIVQCPYSYKSVTTISVSVQSTLRLQLGCARPKLFRPELNIFYTLS